MSCSSSSSSELITTGGSCGLKGVASLVLFLGFGLASSFLTLLSFHCLGDGEVQGPDIRPKALGLWSLFGLGGPITSSAPTLSSSSPIEANTSAGLLLGKSAEFVLGHLVGGVVFVPRLPPGGGSPGFHVDCRMASRYLDIHLRVGCVLGHPDFHRYIPSACPSPRG